ncbi:vesicle-associated membrane protein-like protein [Lojkania enalia]|uniref:Synaptobrevin homolog YKT6 n=1 Tax=Lojkania enalia TaxID=147567 RepID=A0A9P4KB84_9PLEO|nr:vesicle-associated membrane protein-like protein [Didymosphaeria enalia]
MASSSTATPLLYACIAHNTTILSEHSSSAASGTSSIPSLILPKIDRAKDAHQTFIHDNYYINIFRDAGLTFLVISPKDFGRRIPFGFLANLKDRFEREYEGTDFASLPSYGCASFNGQLKKLMYEQGATQAGQQDALRTAQQEIDEVRGIMTENIERVLERGERIDLLVDKTDRLGNNARDFRVRSRGLRRRMWWKNVKLMVLLVFVVIFLIYLFVGFGCGLPGKSHFSRLYL